MSSVPWLMPFGVSGVETPDQIKASAAQKRAGTSIFCNAKRPVSVWTVGAAGAGAGPLAGSLLQPSSRAAVKTSVQESFVIKVIFKPHHSRRTGGPLQMPEVQLLRGPG